MSPQPLRIRILHALELGPMTPAELSQHLCAPRRSVWEKVVMLYELGVLTRERVVSRKPGRPHHVYRFAA